jgi:putative restriction endonuclease
MDYWWVNHKQTSRAEIEGGYIWSPKTKKNGVRNETYLNLTRTQIGDLVFSYANARIGHVGIVTSTCEEFAKPDFGSAGDDWAQIGWKVEINWSRLKNPIVPKQHIEEIRPHLLNEYSPIRPDGNGNEAFYLTLISPMLGALLLSFDSDVHDELIDSALSLALSTSQNEMDAILHDSAIGETERSQLVNARLGQGKFKRNVSKIESACRVTGMANIDLLIASHIKPWHKCSNSERLDGNNGLLLSPHVDRLFDRGWISFDNSGRVLVSRYCSDTVLQYWKIDLGKNVGAFNSNQCNYLDFHRSSIFKK